MTPKTPTTSRPATQGEHTPGPWFQGCSTREGGCQIITVHPIRDEPNALIATVNARHTITPGVEVSDTVRANARLIAAAPELLAALEIAATTLETVYRERDPKNIAAKCAAERARDAIAKATQQPS